MDKKVSFLEVVKFVGQYWLRFPIRLGVIVVGVFAGVIMQSYIPELAANVQTAFEAYSHGEADLDTAWWAAATLIGMFAAVSILQQGYFRVWMYFASEVMHNIVYDAFRQVQRFSSDWHANSFSGSTVRQMTRGMWAYDSYADTVVVDLTPGFALMIAMSVHMYLRDPLLGIYFAITVVVFIAVTIFLSLVYVAPANRLSNDADTELGGVLADAVTCNMVVKSFGAEVREDAVIFDVTGRWRVRARTSWMRSMDAGAIQSLMIILMLGGLMAIVLRRIASGDMGSADVVFVLVTYFTVNNYLRNIGWQVRELQKSVNELDDLVRFSKTEPQVADIKDAVDFVPGAGDIVVKNVRFKYENQPGTLYDGLDVHIKPGEKVALVGQSGSGKTTFVKLIQRLYDVDEGSIMIDGQDISRVKQEGLRSEISLVPQEPILFHRTLAENICYGRPGATEEEMLDAARRAHAHDFIVQLKEGYDTLVGERGIKLSGGERQRVAIARAILADAPILILDEATSSLDSITEAHIQRGIANLIEGRTAILVAHRLSTIRQVDRILVFDKGSIVEEGTHKELMAKPNGTYRELYDMQTLGFIDDTAETADQESSIAPTAAA